MDADIGDVAPERDQVLTHLEGRRDAHGFDDHVTPSPTGQLHYLRLDVRASVERVMGSHLLRCLQTTRILVDGDQDGWRQQLRRQ